MRDTNLYARILGIQAPWAVTDVELAAPTEVADAGAPAEGAKSGTL